MKNRTLQHAVTTRNAVKKALPDSAMDRLERAIGLAERGSNGQVRMIVEAHWPLMQVKRTEPRQRAIEWFSQLRVWDTEHNNGVLLYLLFAERRVEIVADRGFNKLVTQAQWDSICRALEARFSGGEFELGLGEGIVAIGELLNAHFPADMGPNEQSDRPVLV